MIRERVLKLLASSICLKMARLSEGQPNEDVQLIVLAQLFTHKPFTLSILRNLSFLL